jgi:transposase
VSNKYPDEFRDEAIQLVLAGRTYRSVADALGCSSYTLRAWVKQYRIDNGESAGGPTTAELAEIRELKRKLRRVEQERDILKKATAVFARDTMFLPE